jgi:hypothetical protein
MEIFAGKKIHIVAVYYNNRKSKFFRIHVDVTLADLKHHLSQLNGPLNYHNARVASVGYRWQSVFSDERVNRPLTSVLNRMLRNGIFSVR